jgi:hypothetical protein
MMAPLRRYRVFVWADSDDLAILRDACIQVTWDEGHTADSVISPVASWNTPERVRAADILVCLCRGANENAKEYLRLAACCGRPVLLFLPSNTAETVVSESKLIEDAGDGSCIKSLVDDPLRLAREYALALHGAVRILDAAKQSETSLEINQFPTRFFQRLTSRMSQWWVVDHRSHVNPLLKQAIADYVLDRYLKTLVTARVFKLFFESGSSIAFLSQAFASRLDDSWLRLCANFEIETNNIFSYLEFLVAPAQSTSLFPEGPPDHKYGATYGRLPSVEPQNEGGQRIGDPSREGEVIDEIREHLRRRYSERGLIFSATSGIDWEIGPHVGSYPNRLFKRAVLESRCLNLVLLDEDKLGRRFNSETCFAVCDKKFSWERARHEVPLALACAFSRKEEATTVEPRLRVLGFRNIEMGSKHHAPWCVIAANDRFVAEIERWESVDQVEGRPLHLANNAMVKTIVPGNRHLKGNIRRVKPSRSQGNWSM